jgi:hypothetical protein
MGSGKTTHIINKMNTAWGEEDYDQIVYIAPNLSEVGGSTKDEFGNVVEYEGRIPADCPELHFKNPISDWRVSKREHAKELLVDGHNIAMTHNLFSLVNHDDLEVVSQRKAILIIDEALNTVEPLDFDGHSKITKTDIKLLLDNQMIKEGYKGKLSWIQPAVDGDFKYQKVKELCDSGHLYIASNQSVFVWQFPPEILDAFSEVFVLTYLFNGSVMSTWFDLHGIDYEFYKPESTPSTQESEVKERIKNLLTIRQTPKANSIGKRSNALSFNWYLNANKATLFNARSCCIDATKNGMRGISANEMLVTCPKDMWKRGKLKGNGYTKATWLASNTRATNKYSDKKAVLYLTNKYPNMAVNQYFKSQGIQINEDLYALSEMLQFIWRGCIRNYEPMVVYIPSSRMRNLLIEWLDCDVSQVA